jgi:hypothetical protein
MIVSFQAMLVRNIGHRLVRRRDLRCRHACRCRRRLLRPDADNDVMIGGGCFLRRRLKSLHDGFRKRLSHRDGTHVDNDLIDLAIFVQVHLIDRLKQRTMILAAAVELRGRQFLNA